MPTVFIVRCPHSPLRGDTRLLLRGAVPWAQLCSLLGDFTAASDMGLHFDSQYFPLPFSPRKGLPVTFSKLQLNFNSCSQPILQLTFKEASQFPSELPLSSNIGQSGECLTRNCTERCPRRGFNLHRMCLVSTKGGTVCALWQFLRSHQVASR